jgi:DNA helicase II / ATP-dependent DNA helicase PcrA
MSRNEQNQQVFDRAYQALNPEQKRAVDTIEGPVMVIAGPGTGKTQILTLRIANILLKTDTPPEAILALTFTESGVKAMRERLHRYVGATSYRVPIHTFHGFAGLLIRDYPEAYARIIGGRPASEIERITIIETILASGDVRLLRPVGDPQYYVTPLLRMISEMKKEYITPDGLAVQITEDETALLGIEKIHEKGAHKGKIRGEYTKAEQALAKKRELLHVYRQYEALLRDRKRYDFEDMILETVRALETNPEMLRDLQERYLYVLADEHQDVNGAQNRILELLASYHDRPNIFVVGDEKQAIYRFQGASLANFLYFEDHFADTTVIALIENYRSGQVILDAAHSLITTDDPTLAALRVPLTAKVVPQSSTAYLHFSHQGAEDAWVVHEVETLLKQGESPEDIAIIVRSNREVEQLSALLRQAAIPVRASAESDILEHPLMYAVEALIGAVAEGSNEAALFTVLHGAYWDLSNADMVRILAERSYQRTLAQIIVDPALLAEIGVVEIDKVLRVGTVLSTARARALTLAPHRVLSGLLEESGLIAHVIAHDPHEGSRVVRRLYDAVEAMVADPDGPRTLEAVMRHLALLREHKVALSVPLFGGETQAVLVMTAHKSKGLEFGTVFLPHIHDSNWGGGVRRSLFTVRLSSTAEATPEALLDDECRLLYVGMTRAKHTLYLSTAAMSIESKALVPSRLLDRVEGQYLPVRSSEAFEATLTPLSTLGVIPTIPLSTVTFLTESLQARGFSATSFNNYLKNPWDYLYRNVLRVPEVQALPLLFGTSMHAVLQYATHMHTTTGTLPSLSVLRTQLELALQKLPLSVSEFTQLFEKGLAALAVYHDAHLSALPKQTREEIKLRVLLPTGIPDFPELILTGSIDRMDFADDGKALRVVDYKTGRPKTRNDIEGKTESSHGEYKRQLVFYALLLELHGNDMMMCNEGVLSFIEPTPAGVIKEESFIISREDIDSLKAELIQAVKDIMTGAFLLDDDLKAESKYQALIAQWGK